MKKHYTLYVVVCCLLTITACKKNEQPMPDASLNAGQSTFAATAYRPLTVITIAGQDYQYGYVDGPGKQAQFKTPRSIQIAEDGSLFVVDELSYSIRKISTDNVVSTVKIPPSSDGQTLQEPNDLFIGKDGTMTILQNVFFTDKTTHPFWIISPAGQVTTPARRVDNYWDYRYGAVVYDPYSNYLKTCGGRRVVQHQSQYTPFMEDLEIRNGVIGANRYVPPIDSFAMENRGASTFTVMYCAYNGVKYFVSQNRYIFKLTPSGVFTRIYRDFDMNSISSIVATKDSRTIYIVNRGKIEAISNGNKTFLVGPNLDYTKVDGVGSEANVHAIKLALSKDERTIYFTDSRNTIRKLILK
jgi:hypothetical protein